MTSGYQCERCGTQHGFYLGAGGNGGRARVARCLARSCPTTVRAVLWRLFGKRWPRSAGQPTVRQRVLAVFWPSEVADEGFTPPAFWPIKGPMGLCREGNHLAAYNMGPGIGLVEFDSEDNMTTMPADAWGCSNCHCGWQEPAVLP